MSRSGHATEAKLKRSFPRHRRWIVFAAVWLIACPFMLGCGSSRLPMIPVQGKVTHQGKPLTFGAVIVQPDIGPPAIGAIQSDGSFRLATEGREGVVVGKHKVAITCYDTEAPGRAPDPKGRLGKLLIPSKYIHTQTSGLVVDVKPDTGIIEVNYDVSEN